MLYMVFPFKSWVAYSASSSKIQLICPHDYLIYHAMVSLHHLVQWLQAFTLCNSHMHLDFLIATLQLLWETFKNRQFSAFWHSSTAW